MARMTWEQTKQELGAKGISLLSDDLGAKFNEDGSVTLFKLPGYSPEKIAYLTCGEMNGLVSFYVDGCCPVCLVEIPLNDVICDDCLNKANSTSRRGAGWRRERR